jgi:hypothetical protein
MERPFTRKILLSRNPKGAKRFADGDLLHCSGGGRRNVDVQELPVRPFGLARAHSPKLTVNPECVQTAPLAARYSELVARAANAYSARHSLQVTFADANESWCSVWDRAGLPLLENRLNPSLRAPHRAHRIRIPLQ